MHHPDAPADAPPADSKICFSTAFVFEDSEQAALAALAPFAQSDLATKCLVKMENQPFDFEGLYNRYFSLNDPAGGVQVVDALTGNEIEVDARVTVNAAGAACRPWMERLGAKPDFPLLKAMNLVTSRPAGPLALSAPTAGGRLLLIMPWSGRMLVGTSHSDQPAAPDDLRVYRGELQAFVDEVNSAFPALGLDAAEVTLVHRGVVPAYRNRRGVLGLLGHHRIHDHDQDGVAGAVSVAGVKYTTARGVALSL